MKDSKMDSGNLDEIMVGSRFKFGENWNKYINRIDNENISKAIDSLKIFLGRESLEGCKFLDIGCGSGIFSLAAIRLGATVVSFDYDPASVACTKHIKSLYQIADERWLIFEGSILDTEKILELGKFDIVYSWGVLHHTGNMDVALKNAAIPVKSNGILYIAIYNDQGRMSRFWKSIKKKYISSNIVIRSTLNLIFLIGLWGPSCLRDLMILKPFETWKAYSKNRGMSPMIDLVDWIGGYPFEVASPGKILEQFHELNFNLIKLKTCGGGHGCNEYAFQKK